MKDLLFVGVGWTDLAITLNRIAVGAFFMLSGYHKLFNAERHRLIVDELKALGVPAVGFNQWWVPLVEFAAGGAVLIGLFGTTRRAWPACHHPRRHRHVRAAAIQTVLSRCGAASAKCRYLMNHAAATASRHVVIAAARSARCVWAEESS